MGKLADALGVGPQFTYKGQTYQASQLTIKHRAIFETWVERQAWEALERSMQWVRRATYETAVAKLTREIAAQKYAFGSEAYIDAVNSLPGKKYQLYLALKDNHPECDEQWIDEYFENRMDEATRVQKQTEGQKDAGETDSQAGE